jgi:hypothetical protein
VLLLAPGAGAAVAFATTRAALDALSAGVGDSVDWLATGWSTVMVWPSHGVAVRGAGGGAVAVTCGRPGIAAYVVCCFWRALADFVADPRLSPPWLCWPASNS